MSRLFGRKSAAAGSKAAHNSRSARAGRARALRPEGRAQRILCLSLWLLCAAAPAAYAQEAQIVESAKPVKCNQKDYKLGLVRVEAFVNSYNAKTLGVVLTPEEGEDGRAFFLYWLDEKSESPSSREDTNGKLGSVPVSYGDGRIGKVPVLKSFLSAEAGCQMDEPQLARLLGLLDGIKAAPDDLRAAAGVLAGPNGGDAVGQIKSFSSNELSTFHKLNNDPAFYQATRQFMSSLWNTEWKAQDPNRLRALWNAERKALLDVILELGKHSKILEENNASLLGGTSLWLWLVFLITLPLTLMGAVFAGRKAHYHLLKLRGAVGSDDGRTLEASADAKVAQIMGILAAINGGARTRHVSINEKHSRLSGANGGSPPSAEDRDDLLQGIMAKLKLKISSRDLNWARAIIEEGLHKASTAAGSCREYADDLDKAFSDVQSQLVALRQKVSGDDDELTANAVLEPAPPSPPVDTDGARETGAILSTLATDVAAVKSGMDGLDARLAQLDQLVTSVNVVKSGVERFDTRMLAYAAADRGLLTIGLRWYGSNYSGDRTEALIEEVCEAIDLHHLLSRRLGNNAASVAQTKDCLVRTLDCLTSIGSTYFKDLPAGTAPMRIASEINRKLADDAARVKEFGAIEEALRGYAAREPGTVAAVKKLIEDEKTAREKLSGYHPGLRLVEIADAVVATYSAFALAIKRALPTATGPLITSVTLLADQYQRLKPDAERAQALSIQSEELKQQLSTARAESEAGAKLARVVVLRLNYEAGDTTQDAPAVARVLERFEQEAESGIYLQLRMALSAALTALEKATKTDDSDEQRVVLDALLLDKVKQGVRDLLARMGDYSGEQLWSEGIYDGFDRKWLHYLLRADLLLSSYYAEQREFGPLRKAVSLACSALLAALYEFEVEVVEVGLFGELPRNMETASIQSLIRKLPAVREKIQAKLQNSGTGELTVDVTSFPYLVKGRQENRGCASLANPSAWLQL